MKQKLTDIDAITNFIFAEDSPIKADLIIVPGSSHYQLPKKAVYLYKRKFADKILFTGGFNQKIEKNECDFGREIALKAKVLEKDIYCEDLSLNTKENASESVKIIKKNHLAHKTILLVCKPYHSRRVEMTFAKFFPESRLIMIPTEDERNITKDNWWKDKENISKAMEEIGKISEYFLKGDLELFSSE